jgi:hypothetical protein
MADHDFDEKAYRERLIAAGLDPDAAAATAAKTAAAHRARLNPTTESLMAEGLDAKTAQNTAKQRKGRAAGANPLAVLAPDLFGVLDQQPPAAPAAPSEAPAVPPAAADSTPKEKPKGKAAKPLFKPIEGELTTRQKQLIEDALEVEKEDARKANATGYMARTLAQATLPHTDPKIPLGQLYSRDTGKLTLTVAPTSKRHGIPYGTVPRLILAWICTEAVHTQDRSLSLGHSQAEFLQKIGMHSNGRDIGRFKDQALRLFKSVISVEYADDQEGDESARLLISSQSHVFWHPKRTEQRALWDSTLELSQDFHDEILKAPVPIDMRVFHALTKSPLAMDVYTWLTYRMFVLRRSGRPFVLVPWIGLKMQFGAGYPDTQQGLYNFKDNFKKRLREVLNFYPEARDCIEDDKKAGCLKLWPAQLHIPHQKRKALGG